MIGVSRGFVRPPRMIGFDVVLKGMLNINRSITSLEKRIRDFRRSLRRLWGLGVSQDLI